MNFETSKKSGEHFKLYQLAGEWKGITKTWFEPGKLADESPMIGTIRPVLDGRFMIHEYKGSIEGKPLEGISIYGCNLYRNKFQSVNIDSFHNGTNIMFSTGDAGGKFNVLGSYEYDVSPEETQHWGWRTEIELVSEDNLVITIYNITPEGMEAKVLETDYKRIK